MTAEAYIAARLEPRSGSLPLGTRLRLMLEQDIFDGIRWRAGPHTVGWVERPSPHGVRIRLVPTAAGRTAQALLEDELLEVLVSRDHPPVVRLTAEVDP